MSDRNYKLKKAIELLQFAVSTGDTELIKSIIESVVEMLEELKD